MEVTIFEQFRFDPVAGRIEGWTDRDLDSIRAVVRGMGVAVLQGVFPPGPLRAIRESAFGYMHEHAPENPPITPDTKNYWRRDDNPPKSAVKRVNQFFSSFYWNRDLAGEKAMLKAMSRLKNRIAGLPEEFALHGIEQGYVTYPTITHYPRGGGRQNKHTDPRNIQFCVIICSMSSRGEDYASGGIYVESRGERMDIDGHLGIGDIYLISPDLVHGVEAIDPEAGAPQWADPRGRWTLFPSLIELVTTQGVMVEGLVDLDARGG